MNAIKWISAMDKIPEMINFSEELDDKGEHVVVSSNYVLCYSEMKHTFFIARFMGRSFERTNIWQTQFGMPERNLKISYWIELPMDSIKMMTPTELDTIASNASIKELKQEIEDLKEYISILKNGYS